MVETEHQRFEASHRTDWHIAELVSSTMHFDAAPE
jgi:hypothetical protein